MAFKTGAGLLIETDLDQYLDTPIGTPDFQDICAVSAEYSGSETTDTFYELCKNGLASNKVTAIDAQWNITVKVDENNAVWSAIYGKKFTTDRTYPFKITDNIDGSVYDFNGEITDFSDTRVVDSVVEFSFLLKVADGTITIT